MATVINEVDQIADPDHPNRQKENRKFGHLEAGARVYLVDKVRRMKVDFWQVDVATGQRADGQLGWIPAESRTEPNIEAFIPDCPTEFPLTPESFRELEHNEDLMCFGNTELTLSGNVTCNRPIIEYAISGASWIDGQRSCFLGLEGDLYLYGDNIYSLLESPPVDSITGRYLVRGHFDDPEAQGCYSIPFGTPPSAFPGESPDPEAVMGCRQMFVVSTVIARD